MTAEPKTYIKRGITIVGSSDAGTCWETSGDLRAPTIAYTHEQDGDIQEISLGLFPSPKEIDNGELGEIIASVSIRTTTEGYEPDDAKVESISLTVSGNPVELVEGSLKDRIECIADSIADTFFDRQAWFNEISKDFTREDFRRIEWAEGVE